jgi:hypothetical protein
MRAAADEPDLEPGELQLDKTPELQGDPEA